MRRLHEYLAQTLAGRLIGRAENCECQLRVASCELRVASCELRPRRARFRFTERIHDTQSINDQQPLNTRVMPEKSRGYGGWLLGLATSQ